MPLMVMRHGADGIQHHLVCPNWPRPSQARVTPMESPAPHMFFTKSEEMEAKRAEQTKHVCSAQQQKRVTWCFIYVLIFFERR